MRIRIKFTKNEMVKYLGHLDIMRAFQRFFNCAGVKMEYSSGFNPHQKMHFALPLGVGITSKAEYLDAQIADGQDPEKIRDDLDAVTGSAFDIIHVRELLPDADKAMASVCFAEYKIVLDGISDLDIDSYLSRERIILQKKTKTGIRDVDVKSLIINMSWKEHALSILMKTGSTDSIKPELICADLLSFSGLEAGRNEMHICRMELYGPGIVPLDEYQVVRS